MKKWVSVKERIPPEGWHGLVLTNVRKDRPVFAHTATSKGRDAFPILDDFLGRWRESILTGDHMREEAQVEFWLETDEPLYPDIPNWA